MITPCHRFLMIPFILFRIFCLLPTIHYVHAFHVASPATAVVYTRNDHLDSSSSLTFPCLFHKRCVIIPATRKQRLSKTIYSSPFSSQKKNDSEMISSSITSKHHPLFSFQTFKALLIVGCLTFSSWIVPTFLPIGTSTMMQTSFTSSSYSSLQSIIVVPKAAYAANMVRVVAASTTDTINIYPKTIKNSPPPLSYSTVLDEVWTLCNKYYLDQAYIHQQINWNDIRSYYENQLPITMIQSSKEKDKQQEEDNNMDDGTTMILYDDDKAMTLATDMISTLHDKYTRILDKESYARIQKYDLIGIGATLMPESNNDNDLEYGNIKEEENVNDSLQQSSTTSTITSSSSSSSSSTEPITYTKDSKSSTQKLRRIIVGAPPVPGSAADKAGLKVGDIIAAVNGIPTAGRTAFDIIDQISEDPNANSVTMTVMSRLKKNSIPTTITPMIESNSNNNNYNLPKMNDEYTIRDVTMERETTKVTNPISYLISERRSDGTVVGYVKISEFNSLVKSRLEEALISLEKDGANAYVLDLRNNPGGAFQSAVEISGLFMENKLATKVIDANNIELPFRTTSHGLRVNPSHPIVIWVDHGSASASEVFAGALHDQCRAVVAGSTNSYGKGLIQAVYGLKNGYGLVLTVARYVTPNGLEIQGSGIAPDMNINLPLLSIRGLPFTSDVNFKEAVTKMSAPYCIAPE